MRRFLFIPLIVIQAASAFGQAQTPAPENEARQHLADVLNGRSIQGHLYPDPSADPEQHVAVSLPVVDGALQFDTLKGAYPTMSKSAVVLIRGEDQTDKDAARVLERFILVFDCEPGPREPTLADRLEGHGDLAPSWTFIDAVGQPMVGASIEARTSFDIVAYKATLDDKGQTPLRVGTSFTFRVEHPNYGVALMESMYVGELPSAVYIVPLMPRDSGQFSLAAQGEVIDNTGKPVRNARVSCTGLVGLDGNDLYAYPLDSVVITDAYGQFAICLPIVTEELLWQGPPPAGAQYHLRIEPPVESNLRQTPWDAQAVAQAGKKQTFILTPMDAQEYFHTFSFEYAEGPVIGVDELRNIGLTLMRDGRLWRHLKYEQWKDGVALPQGELRAGTLRWGEPFSFGDVVLTAESPTNIVVKSPKPLTYRGRVVDGLTGKPMPDVVVETYRTYAPGDPRSEVDKSWQQLRERATREAADGSAQILYQAHNRATVTDANGVFQFTFVPGIASYMHEFYATAPDRRTGQTRMSPMFPRPDRVIDVGTIRLSRPEDRTHQFPTMIFHDENGPVADPARLKAIEIDIRSPGLEIMGARPYDDSLEEREFRPGTYCAQAEWDRKLYTFEPVEVNSPLGVFTFRPKSIERADIVYEGRVIHAVTGQPVANAVILRGKGTPEYDPAPLTSEQWAAIRALGAQIDPNAPAMAPLRSIFERPGAPTWQTIECVTQTDSDGRFSLPVKQGLESAWNSLLVVAPDFLGLEQSLDYTVFPEGRGFEGREDRRLEADANGVAHVPLIRLVPAAKVTIHPVVSDPGYGNEIQSIQFNWTSEPSRTPHVLTSPPGTPDTSLFYTRRLQPNTTQSVYIPADAKLVLTMHSDRLPLPPAHLGTVTLKQGEVLDLGRVKFPTGVRVAVKVVDSKGKPVPGVRIYCRSETGFRWTMMRATDDTGREMPIVPANSSGRFLVRGSRDQTSGLTEETVAYKVGGPEDTGREFLLRLPGDFQPALEFARRTPPSPPVPNPGPQPQP